VECVTASCLRYLRSGHSRAHVPPRRALGQASELFPNPPHSGMSAGRSGIGATSPLTMLRRKSGIHPKPTPERVASHRFDPLLGQHFYLSGRGLGFRIWGTFNSSTYLAMHDKTAQLSGLSLALEVSQGLAQGVKPIAV